MLSREWSMVVVVLVGTVRNRRNELFQKDYIGGKSMYIYIYLFISPCRFPADVVKVLHRVRFNLETIFSVKLRHSPT